LEPAIRATDGHIEDEIEIFVERSVIAASEAPRVVEACTIAVRQRELTLGPEWFVEADIHDLEKASVDVGEDILLAPFNTIGVEAASIGCMQRLSFDIVSPPAIVSSIGSPVKRAAHNVVATLRISVVVAAGFHDVNFTGARPWSIGVCGWKHPDGRPQPISRRQLCGNLNSAELDLGANLGANAARLNRRDDGAIGLVGGRNAVGIDSAAADALLNKVDDAAVSIDESLILKGWLNVEHAILNVDILISHCCFFKFTVAITTDFRLFCPDLGVEPLRPVFVENRAVCEVRNRSQSVPDQNSRYSKTQEDAKEWDDGDPFLLWIFLASPRPFNLTLLDSSGVEVFGVWKGESS